jgi:tetratricopeptide (TPR) repeat protein
MADRIPGKPVKLLFGLLAALSCLAAQAGSLVSYSFDDDRLDTGPDTFRIFEHSRGTARLSPEFRYSGYYSVEIRDAADDGGFPELQGYFPMQESGTLYVHFAFMTPEPMEPFNIALAGPEWFKMKRDGIGFWLKNRQGHFYHVSDSMPKRLQPIQPFTWYLVDLTYRVGEGSYDLVIHEEYAEQPLVNIKNAANTTNSPESRVSVFSFIGDLPDEANAVIYVDDIEIRSDRIDAPGLVAPGRRKLFVDYWRDLERAARRKPQCIATTGFRDFDISSYELSELSASGALTRLEQVLGTSGRAITPGLIDDLPAVPKLRAVARWRLGCYLLKQGEAELALEHFRQAEAAVPGARIYHLSTTLALAALGKFAEVNNRISNVYGLWYGDERFAAAQAMIGLARHEDWASEAVLQDVIGRLQEHFAVQSVAELWTEGPDSQLVETLRKRYPDKWEEYLRERLLLEQYYFLLLWRDAFFEAQQFAQQVAGILERENGSAGVWYEFIANAAFLAGDNELALDYYELALSDSEHNHARSHSVYLKLSDLFHLIGDPKNERYYREQVYGSLTAGNP